MPFAGGIRRNLRVVTLAGPTAFGYYKRLPVALLDEVVHQLARAVVHLDVERLHLTGEVVERHNGRDGDEKSECRRHKGFRDTAGDCADTGGLLRCNLLEGVQDTDDGSEQTDKGCRRSDRCQTAETTLQLGVNDCLRALQCTLRALNLLFGDVAARTEAAELLQTGNDDLCQVRLLRTIGNLDRLIQTAILERAGNLRSKL